MGTVRTAAILTTVAAAVVAVLPASASASTARAGVWRLSNNSMGVANDRMIEVKLDPYRVMWIGGAPTTTLADGRRAFIYDIRTRRFHEVASVPAAKTRSDTPGTNYPMLSLAAAGVLADGSVVVAGGQISLTDPAVNAGNVLSYRYYPNRDRWVRTGDLPEPQDFSWTPTNLLHDGRLLAVAGRAPEAIASGSTSVHAFLFDPNATTQVDEIDRSTGKRTGERVTVRGSWDYTRTADGAQSTLSEGHYFGNSVLLRDGRVLVLGGHRVWRLDTDDYSVLSRNTDFFDPVTGAWTQGPVLPTVPGEDDRILNSHGGRANGVCMSVLHDNRVVIAGGNTQVDHRNYFRWGIGRQSILVLTPAADAAASTFQLAPSPIPPGTDFGGLYGDGGRNQLPCWLLPDDRVLIGGGQDVVGEDLWDTYVFNPDSGSIRRGPDLPHAHPSWAEDFGYPADYQAPLVSTRSVNMRVSRLTMHGDVLVNGGGFDVQAVAYQGFPYAEQIGGRF